MRRRTSAALAAATCVAALAACSEQSGPGAPAERVFWRVKVDASDAPNVLRLGVAGSVPGSFETTFVDRPSPRPDGGSWKDVRTRTSTEWHATETGPGGTTIEIRIDGGDRPVPAGITTIQVGGGIRGTTRSSTPPAPPADPNLRLVAQGGAPMDASTGYLELDAGESRVLRYWVWARSGDPVTVTTAADGSPVLSRNGAAVALHEHDAPVWIYRAWFEPLAATK